MKLQCLTLGLLETNCYLVADDDGSCAVIDPGYQAQQIAHAAQKNGWSIRAILLTHGHFDHVGSVRELVELCPCPVWIHPAEQTMPTRLTAGALYATDFYDEGDTVTVGKLRFTVLHTPGHTPGSVCLQCQDALFTGDTLFADACGRTDLPGGSAEQMRQSLARLRGLSEDFAVYPGHGEKTSLALEQRKNPYLR